MKKQIIIAEQNVPAGWVVGPPSRLLDVWSPSPLIMVAPKFRYLQHTVQFSYHFVSKKSSAETRTILNWLPRRSAKGEAIVLSDSEIGYDCRHDSTGNIAHVLQNQMGVALHGLEAIGRAKDWRDLRFIVNEQTPIYSINLFRAMGFKVSQTDGPVSGTFITMEPPKFPFRPLAGVKLREHAIGLGILGKHDKPGEPIFIARKGRRAVVNQDVIEPILNGAGYRTIYPEDLSAEEQIQTISCAKNIVGLHGAALGYMMFRDPAIGGVLIESFSSAFATNWARSIASTKNTQWVGCIGDFNYKAMRQIANGAHSHQHEADNYHIYPDSLRIILKSTNNPGIISANITKYCLINIPKMSHHLSI